MSVSILVVDDEPDVAVSASTFAASHRILQMLSPS